VIVTALGGGTAQRYDDATVHRIGLSACLLITWRYHISSYHLIVWRLSTPLYRLTVLSYYIILSLYRRIGASSSFETAGPIVAHNVYIYVCIYMYEDVCACAWAFLSTMTNDSSYHASRSPPCLQRPKAAPRKSPMLLHWFETATPRNHTLQNH
jgi:hypothetical protein